MLDLDIEPIGANNVLSQSNCNKNYIRVRDGKQYDQTHCNTKIAPYLGKSNQIHVEFKSDNVLSFEAQLNCYGKYLF